MKKEERDDARRSPGSHGEQRAAAKHSQTLTEPSTELEKLIAKEWNITHFTSAMLEALNRPMIDKLTGKQHQSANEMYATTPLFRVWLQDEYLSWAKDPYRKQDSEPFNSARLCYTLPKQWDWWAAYCAENAKPVKREMPTLSPEVWERSENARKLLEIQRLFDDEDDEGDES